MVNLTRLKSVIIFNFDFCLRYSNQFEFYFYYLKIYFYVNKLLKLNKALEIKMFQFEF